MPEELNMFPSYLRKAGYHTSNAAKTDYNCFLDKTAWDIVEGKIGEWRNRPDKNMPFFMSIRMLLRMKGNCSLRRML